MERENEFEDPGSSYPDEGGSTTAAPPSPAADDPAAASADDPSAASADDSATAPVEEQVAPAQEPSHQAVGIGVQDAEARDGGGAATAAEADASTDHHGQDGGRDSLTVSEAQQTAGALGSEQEQRLPAMAQNNASDVEKVAGIVAQTRGDIGTHPVEEIERVLAQRFEQSGVELPADEVAELARQISTGDASGPE